MYNAYKITVSAKSENQVNAYKNFRLNYGAQEKFYGECILHLFLQLLFEFAAKFYVSRRTVYDKKRRVAGGEIKAQLQRVAANLS